MAQTTILAIRCQRGAASVLASFIGALFAFPEECTDHNHEKYANEVASSYIASIDAAGHSSPVTSFRRGKNGEPLLGLRGVGVVTLGDSEHYA